MSLYLKKNGFVQIKKLKLKKKVLENLRKNFVLYFTGYSRKSYKILKKQNQDTNISNKEMINNLHEVKDLAYNFKNYLINDDLNNYGLLMDHHWNLKKKRSKNMTNKKINNLYDYAKDNGAIGGKLIGAGGGGFFLFYTKNSNYLEKKMKKKGLEKTDFKFDFEPPKIIS